MKETKSRFFAVSIAAIILSLVLLASCPAYRQVLPPDCPICGMPAVVRLKETEVKSLFRFRCAYCGERWTQLTIDGERDKPGFKWSEAIEGFLNPDYP